ncbi:31322_t:CDS:2 [Gigaspora margarita]|uniref:31322_t:CDS:1 n=1 Tax=Gigaspora margarita TaxID=4874 RepID=A0ABN7USV1_GIGMA|nr:31322_t:CDS:2 [Gigaspora margarita]
MREAKKKNNGDNIPIIDNAYDFEDDEAAETVFEKLTKNACNLDKDSYWKYTGNSFFDKANDMNLNNNEITQSDYTSKSETEIIEKSSQWDQKLQEPEKRIQHLINTNKTSKTDKVKKYLKDDFLPPSQCRKHPSKLLFHDEYVSLRIANYL